MKIVTVFVLILLSAGNLSAQLPPLKFDRVTTKDFDPLTSLDTTAGAVILFEEGQSYGDPKRDVIVYEKYMKVRILKRSGLSAGDFSIPIRRESRVSDQLLLLEGKSYSMQKDGLHWTKLEKTGIFNEKHEGYVVVKFAIPMLSAGSVFEIRYRISTPGKRNFHSWNFQSDIPKLHSVYTVMMPEKDTYDATLSGSLRLTREEKEIQKGCYNGKANCIIRRYTMDSIPAFREEEYMGPRTNYISWLNFHLTGTGSAKEDKKLLLGWKNINTRLRPVFAGQISRAASLLKKQIRNLVAHDNDTLQRAKLVYSYVAQHYEWNGFTGRYPQYGVLRSWQTRKGNDADINLALIGALKDAGIKADVVLLRTRENGLANDAIGSIGQYNYLVARVNIKGKRYLLDALSPLSPFGAIPLQCMNGFGHVMYTSSEQADLGISEASTEATVVNLTLHESGVYKGNMTVTTSGFEAFAKRVSLKSFSNEDRLKMMRTVWKDIEINDYKVTNREDVDSLLTETMSLKVPGDSSAQINVLFPKPFIVDLLKRNPLSAEKRLYPVDFQIRSELTYTYTLTIPDSFVFDEVPENASFELPDKMTSYSMVVTKSEHKVTITSKRITGKSVYSPSEYGLLREFFSHVVQVQDAQVVVRKKSANK